ncbi:MAG: hypothetical protein IPK42_15185 [Betaproteobacteria bacterium]|nr:hypothetical protein [Betaproteobacteria bacterium]
MPARHHHHHHRCQAAGTGHRRPDPDPVAEAWDRAHAPATLIDSEDTALD